MTTGTDAYVTMSRRQIQVKNDIHLTAHAPTCPSDILGRGIFFFRLEEHVFIVVIPGESDG